MLDINELPERFWKKVDRSGGLDACWPWLAATVEGYPIYVNKIDRSVRRYLWFLIYGEQPTGTTIICTLGNIGCVNPLHLVKQTWKERTQRAKDRGTFWSPFTACDPEQYAEYQATAKAVREALGHHHVITPEERGKGHKTRGCTPGGTDQSQRVSFNMTRVERRQFLKDPCVYCNDIATEVDHIRPFSKGGANDAMNRAATCFACNRSKNNLGIVQFLIKRQRMAA